MTPTCPPLSAVKSKNVLGLVVKLSHPATTVPAHAALQLIAAKAIRGNMRNNLALSSICLRPLLLCYTVGNIHPIFLCFKPKSPSRLSQSIFPPGKREAAYKTCVKTRVGCEPAQRSGLQNVLGVCRFKFSFPGSWRTTWTTKRLAC